MTIQVVIVLLVAAQRLAEVAYAQRNTKVLRKAGAVEHGAGHYPLFVLLHATWLIVLIAWPMRTLNLWFLAVFGILQVLRIWVVVSLGSRWTTRVLIRHDASLVRRGPYRYARHPNYMIVIGEMAALPLVFGLWEAAALFSVLNGALLAYRIRVENRALADAIAVAGKE